MQRNVLERTTCSWPARSERASARGACPRGGSPGPAVGREHYLSLCWPSSCFLVPDSRLRCRGGPPRCGTGRLRLSQLVGMAGCGRASVRRSLRTRRALQRDTWVCSWSSIRVPVNPGVHWGESLTKEVWFTSAGATSAPARGPAVCVSRVPCLPSHLDSCSCPEPPRAAWREQTSPALHSWLLGRD